ncbi:DNA-3-methyladenine glycosylase family protein [Martelella mediterranea]|uniref:DNA-3-methyladenine glycosylase II n=1 Tax=Martelella mediterranea TaxID=293089 RepID=A0A4R3NER7_9HYPH|nr:DNA-3-methyladenine glycosylase [Martelella mediterranea]TCT28472.1 DNA-3-methyladenine glycosylase II [Martelella mediterranea]
MQRLRHHADLKNALETLYVADPVLKEIALKSGPVPLRLMPGGFAGLAEVVTGQLISKQAASAIFKRFKAVCRPLTPDAYHTLRPEDRNKIGLTRTKQATLEGIARGIVDGTLDLSVVDDMPTEAAIARLTAFKGVGPWTSEVYLMFCAGHADVFPAGDLALRVAVAHAFDLDSKPAILDLKNRAMAWQPYRAAAARLFWAYYAAELRA